MSGYSASAFLKPLSRSVSAGGAGDAAHVDDVALAAELLEQPLGAEVGVLLLVVGEVVGGRARSRPGRRRRRRCRPSWPPSSAGLSAGRVGRVEDDRVDAGGDQVADVLELAGGVGVAVGDVELGDLAGGERLRP